MQEEGPQCEAIFTMRCSGNPDDCFDCAEFVTTCDRCHCAGHTDAAGWHGVDLGNGNVRVLCQDCAEIEID